jgi:hypothetical protein
MLVFKVYKIKEKKELSINFFKPLKILNETSKISTKLVMSLRLKLQKAN